MASTFRSAIRCHGRTLPSLTASATAASKRSLSSRTLSHLQTRLGIHAHATALKSVISTRHLSTPAVQPIGVAQEDTEHRLDIPAFQFRDILPGGELPQTKSLKVNVDEQPAVFDNVFLRDSCSCPTCIDPSTQQKLFSTSDIPLDIYPRRAKISDGKLKIEWSHRIAKCAVPEANVNGYHWSYYDGDFLHSATSASRSVRATMSDFKRVLWNRKAMERSVFWIDYKDYMTDEVALAKALKHLSLYGLIFIRGVPDGRQANQVPGLAERIGNLKNTFYGETWNVKSVPQSKNIAYTSLDLGPHMDLLYFESPPGIQFLHCVENSVKGGQSYFVDGFQAAFMLSQSAPVVFDTLTRFPVNFHYHNDSRHYRFSRPIVVLKDKGQGINEGSIDHMNWGPPFQAPFTIDNSGNTVSNSTTWRSFLRGMDFLNKQFENPQNQFELLLNEGDCAVFANRRVLHARRAFDPNSGNRFLKGGYVDIDAFESACRVLAERYPRQVGGQTAGGEYEYLANEFGQDQWV
ncbi:hypothetical protein Dda_7493 [Drechslerella dactyloides]|uniref:Gamma-butyrobetaine dioxygenase n=1 Tax=Drechslerella dactyloides TaxID=74499 RepID=A0AAD6ISA5_DREDA|nr:hypothetical protein Dda_7493 [Drechslerella dactyloides]